jgi:hypothetical protein
MPGKRHIHTAKFRRCVKKVRAKSKGKYNPYAVCEHAIGYEGSFTKKKVHGMPLTAIEKMVKNPRTPKHLRAYWQKQLKKVV